MKLLRHGAPGAEKPGILDVNGDRRQVGSTRTMVCGVAHLVSYLSQFFTQQPGVVISTGTPPASVWA